MLKNRFLYALIPVVGVLFILLSACSNQKNTAVTRAYHSINTRYNVHFNAQEAYNEALRSKIEGTVDNLSEMVYIYPVEEKDEDDSMSAMSNSNQSATSATSVSATTSETTSTSYTDNRGTANTSTTSGSTATRTTTTTARDMPQPTGGSFGVTIDKTTKAIKEHSIKVKPKRDASKRGDKKYQAWIKQQEFNPFLKNTWILLGKAELQNGDYLRSAATFSYISKIYSTNPEILTECQLWIARSYSEMGWFYEAENILRKIDQRGEVPDKLKSLYSSVYANLYTRLDNYEKAIPHLEDAINREKNKHQKMRMEYLLGQVYTKTGDHRKAYDAFDKIPGMSTPYRFEFNARLQQMELPGMNENNKILSDLNKMAKRSKNKEYLDQIYAAIGKNYLQHQDTTKAIENYRKAIKESTRNGYDKALAQIALGDIFFDRHDFINAQPCYAEALPHITSNNARYPRLSFRSAVLDELVVHAKTVHEQDSLQHLAQLPEMERLEIINQKIENLKKEERERKKQEELERQREQRESRVSGWDDLMSGNLFEDRSSNRAQTPVTPSFSASNDQAKFYFYNTDVVTQGKIAFQKQWGSRKLEDDWRRRSKTASSFGEPLVADIEGQPSDSARDVTQTDNTKAIDQSDNKMIVDDIYSVDYYLQQLPFTAEELKASDDLIEDALYNMGLIYKNKLENPLLAINAFETDIRRFPQTPNLEDIYYQLFLIYMQMGNNTMMAQYRDKLLSGFPSGTYALALSDPNYEWNLKNMNTVQEQLYEETYQAYLKGDVNTVRKNYKEISTKFPFADLMPNFMLLNGLTYVQTRDAENLKSSLTELVNKYPKSDVTPLATNIVNRLNEGKMLLSDGTPITGFDWSAAYAREDDMLSGDSIKQFILDASEGYVLLFAFDKGSIDRNELLFNIANYNFSNYVVQTFDLGFDNTQAFEMLQVKGFKTFDDIKSYINRGFERELFAGIDPAVTVIPIAVENYNAFLVRGIDEYLAFFEANYSGQLPLLMALWNREGDALAGEKDVLVADNKVEKQPEATGVDINASEGKQEPEEEVAEPEKVAATDVEPLENTVVDNKAKEVETKTEEQIRQEEIEEKINENIAAVEELFTNPVDGLKNILKGRQDKPKLTKEEKEAEKERKQLEKEQQKQLRAIEKARQDSIFRVEKAIQDSIQSAEKAKEDSIRQAQKAKVEEQKRLEQERKDALEEAQIARKAEQRRRENERKEKQKAQQERLRQREQERKERERIQKERRQQREKEEKEKAKQREEQRKQQEKERKER